MNHNPYEQWNNSKQCAFAIRVQHLLGDIADWLWSRRPSNQVLLFFHLSFIFLVKSLKSWTEIPCGFEASRLHAKYCNCGF
jgi:hypothetical protein